MKIYQTKYNNLFYKVLADNEYTATARDKRTVFLSYKKSDNEAYLQRTGINIRDKVVEMILHAGDCAVWVDDSGIIGGVDWDEGSIRKALDTCSMMVLLVTPNIFDPDGYIARVEVPTVRKRRDVNNSPLPIYPVIVDESLAENAQGTWERVSTLTGSNEQGDIILSFDGTSQNEQKFTFAIKNVLGEIPDPGVEGKINSVRELLSHNDYLNADIVNTEIRRLAPERYESYWFECQLLTRNFTVFREVSDATGFTCDENTYQSAKNAYKLAMERASVVECNAITATWTKYTSDYKVFLDASQKYKTNSNEKKRLEGMLRGLTKEKDSSKYTSLQFILRVVKMCIHLIMVLVVFILLQSLDGWKVNFVVIAYIIAMGAFEAWGLRREAIFDGIDGDNWLSMIFYLIIVAVFATVSAPIRHIIFFTRYITQGPKYNRVCSDIEKYSKEVTRLDNEINDNIAILSDSRFGAMPQK